MNIWGKFYTHIQALNAMAPQGSVEMQLSGGTFPKVIAQDKRVKSIYVHTGDIVIVDLYGNTATFTGYVGWLDIPVREITSSTVDLVILYLE